MNRWFLVVLSGAFLAGASTVEAQTVKKSASDICYCPGAPAYERTKVFEPYQTIEACYASGGRDPKRSGGISGQGNCATAAGSQSPISQSNTRPGSPAANQSRPGTNSSNGRPYSQRETDRTGGCFSGQNFPLRTYERCGIGVKPIQRREWQ